MPPRQEIQLVTNLELEDKDVTPVKQSGVGQMARRLVTTGKEAVITNNTKRLFYNLLTALLTLGLILSVSVFTYGTFYFAYMPSEVLLIESGHTFLQSTFILRFMKKTSTSSSLHVCPVLAYAASQMPRYNLIPRNTV